MKFSVPGASLDPYGCGLLTAIVSVLLSAALFIGIWASDLGTNRECQACRSTCFTSDVTGSSAEYCSFYVSLCKKSCYDQFQTTQDQDSCIASSFCDELADAQELAVEECREGVGCNDYTTRDVVIAFSIIFAFIGTVGGVLYKEALSKPVWSADRDLAYTLGTGRVACGAGILCSVISLISAAVVLGGLGAEPSASGIFLVQVPLCVNCCGCLLATLSRLCLQGKGSQGGVPAGGGDAEASGLGEI
mmetsp:Transcript_7169/g.17886  ORF Transcript_7169/g.17886 Transcript_7169/m.17886 type:complete len:247 (-) Transcript_7169:50-790(-)